jgi:AcrR family transcriptional regulator
MSDRPTVPRGRHAPPLPVRLSRQRARLLSAAAVVFARGGYLEASAESIAREAGMSKATFYEHFANKEECILQLYDEAAALVARGVARDPKAANASTADIGPRISAFLGIVAAHPDEAQTLLVEMVGAGSRAAERRDTAMWSMAEQLYAANMGDGDGAGPGYASVHDAFAVVGAVVELLSRQLRRGEPERMAELQPVIERLVLGLVGRGE